MKTALLLLLLLLSTCVPEQTTPSVTPSTPEPIPTSPASISLKQVIDAFERANLPLTQKQIYDEKTDPNALLGRPGQYFEKMNFFDSRDTQKRNKCSVEVFRNEEDAQGRKNYVDAIGRSTSILRSYSYLHKNVLVRISFGVLPADAEMYRVTLESL